MNKNWLQNDLLQEIFSKQLIDSGNDKIPIDVLTGCITFPVIFVSLLNEKPSSYKRCSQTSLKITEIIFNWTSELF